MTSKVYWEEKKTLIDVYAEPYFFDVFKSTIDRESTKVGLKALLDLKNDGFAINICFSKSYKNKGRRYGDENAKHAIIATKTTAHEGNSPEDVFPIKPPRGTNAKNINQWDRGQWNFKMASIKPM